jgi:putative oxidoreductase
MIDDRYGPYGIFLLRVALGAVWIAHASLKWFLFTIPGFASWLASVGLPSFMAWPVFIAEVIGGTAIVLGVYARQAALALLPVMLVVVWTHAPNGWVHTNPAGGWEYPLFLVACSLALGLLGDGALALRSTQPGRLSFDARASEQPFRVTE